MSDQAPEVEFLTTVIKAIVEHSDDVRIERTTDNMGVLLVLFVHPDDMGKVIGKSGATATSIRSLLRVVGMKHQARLNLIINDPRKPRTRAAAMDPLDTNVL